MHFLSPGSSFALSPLGFYRRFLTLAQLNQPLTNGNHLSPAPLSSFEVQGISYTFSVLPNHTLFFPKTSPDPEATQEVAATSQFSIPKATYYGDLKQFSSCMPGEEKEEPICTS